MANHTTGAQRYNKRLHKIFDSYKKDLITENGVTLPREIIDSVKCHAYYLNHYYTLCTDESIGTKTYKAGFTKEQLLTEIRDHENDLMWKMHRYLKTAPQNASS